VLDGRRRNTAGGEEGQRPRRRAGVPGEGLANTGNQGAQKHRGEVRGRFPYLIWLRKGWKRVVDGESSSGGSGEGRPGVGTIPARGGRKLDQSRSVS
jgi:hypothetical protein